MGSFFVGPARDSAAGRAVHDRSRCPGACLGAEDAAEYLGEFCEAAQALAVARLRYGAICHCSLGEAAWPWPAPLRPLVRAATPLPP